MCVCVCVVAVILTDRFAPLAPAVTWDKVSNNAPFSARAASTAIAYGETEVLVAAGFDPQIGGTSMTLFNDVWKSSDFGGVLSSACFCLVASLWRDGRRAGEGSLAQGRLFRIFFRNLGTMVGYGKLKFSRKLR